MRQLLTLRVHLSGLIESSHRMYTIGGRGVAGAAEAAGWQFPQLLAPMRPAAHHHRLVNPLISSQLHLKSSRGFAQSAVALEAVGSRRKSSPPQAYGAEQIQVRLHACMHAIAAAITAASSSKQQPATSLPQQHLS
jgi:hypothetical protein